MISGMQMQDKINSATIGLIASNMAQSPATRNLLAW